MSPIPIYWFVSVNLSPKMRYATMYSISAEMPSQDAFTTIIELPRNDWIKKNTTPMYPRIPYPRLLSPPLSAYLFNAKSPNISEIERSPTAWSNIVYLILRPLSFRNFKWEPNFTNHIFPYPRDFQDGQTFTRAWLAHIIFCLNIFGQLGTYSIPLYSTIF